MNVPVEVNPLGAGESLPPGYTRLKCLVGKKGSNLTWVDTGFDVDGTIRWVLDTEFTGTNQWHGAFLGDNKRFEVDTGETRYSFNIANSERYYSGRSESWVRRSVDIDLPNRTVAWSDAEPQEIVTVPAWSGTGRDILLFARAQYVGGNPPSSNISKVYRSTLYKGGELKQDLVPVLDPNGVPCFFDLVTGEQFTNAGTGTFNYETL